MYVQCKKQYIGNMSVRTILIKDRKVWKFTNWLCGTEGVIALDLQLQGLRKLHATSRHKHHNIYGMYYKNIIYITKLCVMIAVEAAMPRPANYWFS